MADHETGALHPLRKLLETHSAKEFTDGQLLARFAAQRDDSAFAALVQRHGPLVYGVCRHVLGHDHDAEDAFQGTFLVLARNAQAIRRQDSVAGWLHGVAYRLSLKARQSAARRRRRESHAARNVANDPPSHDGWRELQAVLDQELARLPEKFRAPFVLCVLENHSKQEAARQLQWHEGTVSSRLARARHLLKLRLSRRGVELSAVLCGLAVADAHAAVPSALGASTVHGAIAYGVGRTVADGSASTHAVALANGWFRSVALSRIVAGLSAVLLLLLAGSTASGVFRRPPEPRPALPAPHQPTDLPQVTATEPAPEGLRKLLVAGRGVAADGSPVAGADVAILADKVRQAGDHDFNVFVHRKVVTAAKADADGRFRFSTARPVVGKDEGFYCLARGAGQTVAWQQLQTLVEAPALVLKLEPAQEARGRLVDSTGAPAAGVKVRVGGFRRPGAILPTFAEETATAAWPAPIVTDAEGRFLLKGLLPRATTHLEVLDQRFGPQWFTVTTADGGATDAGTIKLEAPRVLQGTVVADDDGQPQANAMVTVASYQAGAAGLRGYVGVRTDAAGRFRVLCYPGPSLGVTVGGAPGTPYLATFQKVTWPAGSASFSLEVRLRRGLLVRGQVVELTSGQPVAGARVQYRPTSGKNRNGDSGNLLVLWPWLDVASDANGFFEIVTLPGPGHLLVRGPGHEYIPMEVSERELIDGRPGGGRAHFPDVLVPLDLPKDTEPAPVVARLRRGVTLSGRAVTADGTPVASGFLVTRNYLGQGWENHSEFLPVRDGWFEIPGCDPEVPEDVWFWDPQSLQGATVKLAGNDHGVTVRLAPFGSASVRFVDSDGKVQHPTSVQVHLIVRQGADHRESWANDLPLRLTRNANFQGAQIDPKTGVVTLKALVPDATYLVETGAPGLSATFSIPAGRHVRLPDVAVNAPPKPKQP